MFDAKQAMESAELLTKQAGRTDVVGAKKVRDISLNSLDGAIAKNTALWFDFMCGKFFNSSKSENALDGETVDVESDNCFLPFNQNSIDSDPSFATRKWKFYLAKKNASEDPDFEDKDTTEVFFTLDDAIRSVNLGSISGMRRSELERKAIKNTLSCSLDMSSALSYCAKQAEKDGVPVDEKYVILKRAYTGPDGDEFTIVDLSLLKQMFEKVGFTIVPRVGRDGFVSLNVSGKKNSSRKTKYPGTNSLYTHVTGRCI